MLATFSAPIAHGVAMERRSPSMPVPALRFANDPLMWIALPGGTPIAAFATGCVAREDQSTAPFPGMAAGPWTLLQLSPLPQMDAAAFKQISGGLPLQLVVIIGDPGPTPANDDCILSGQTLVTAPSGGSPTAFMAFAFQDRLCRDPLTAAEAIAASGACDGAWPTFVSDLAALDNARNLRILDASGAPFSAGTVSVAIDGGAPSTVVLDASMDGDTGIPVAPGSRANVAFSSGANPIVAPGDADDGAFEGTGFELAAGARMAQVLDANDWLAAPDPDVTVGRWRAGSLIVPIQEGTPYFSQLVDDLRNAKPTAGKTAGKAGLAGWAFVKGSQADSTVDWPLMPGQPSTTLMNLIQELRGAGVDLHLLVNQFMQFDSATLDDFPELAAILFVIFGALRPAQVLFSIQTDPAGYVVGFLAVAALVAVLTSGVTLDLIKKFAEYSKPLKDALDAIDGNIATWTPYHAAFIDNPLVTPPPFKILGHTLDDLSHLGVYHQKYVVVQPAGGGDPIGYLGGIDINSDRPDTTIHRAKKPFHDVQVRVTGPAVQDLVTSYTERAAHHGAPDLGLPTAAPGETGSHLVQIARTYYKPAPGSPSPAFPGAKSGETTPIRSIKNAIGQARDFIYIEDQYFTPPDDYVTALLNAADNGVRALFVTVPYETDQPYGQIRRADVLAQLSAKWGSRLIVTTPLRRFLHETPALTTNLGRMRLANALTAGAAQCDLSPLAHIPEPPFWGFIEGELVLFYDKVGGPSGVGATARQTLEIWRATGTPSWGATPVAHVKDAPVMAVQIPGIYVHAKVMIVDDIFLFAGSSNINRRGLYHDGEMNSFTVPQHLRGDPTNPARLLRSRLMAEHLGLSPEIGRALFADALSAIPHYRSRSWYQGSQAQSLDFFGSLPPSVPLGTSDSAFMWVLKILIGAAREAAKPDVWPLLADPTTTLDPSPASKGPEFP